MRPGEQRIAQVIAAGQNGAKRNRQQPGQQSNQGGARKQATALLPHIQILLNFGANLRGSRFHVRYGGIYFLNCGLRFLRKSRRDFLF